MEVQTKTALRKHLTTVRVAMIKKSYNRCWGRCGQRGSLLFAAGEMQINTVIVEISWTIHQDIKSRTTIGPSSLTPGHIPENTMLYIEIFAPHIHCRFIHYRKEMEPV